LPAHGSLRALFGQTCGDPYGFAPSSADIHLKNLMQLSEFEKNKTWT